jgi:hypothetical protein
VTAATQILIARAFNDPFGQRRLRLVAIGELQAGRIVTRAAAGQFALLQGVVSGGDFVFLSAQQPIGFFTGSVTRSGGAAVSSALVTTDTTVLADVTSTTGSYLIPTLASVDAALRAIDSISRDTAAASLRVDTPGQVVTANLTLAVVGPTVTSVTPTTGTTNVALDTSITIDFSEALDPASVTETSVVLQLAGAPVAGQRLLSADRRRVVFRPSSPLAGISSYTLQLTSALRDPAGNALSGFSPVSFTTLDPSRPAGPAPGQIVAELPDDDGFVLVTGAAGVAAAHAPVTLTNLRTQETSTVLALSDGSFRLGVTALIGDGLVLSLRGPDGRDATIGITQLVRPDGSTSIGDGGGTIAGPGGLTGTLLPRALTDPGIFRLADADSSGLPTLASPLAYTRTFGLTMTGAKFRTLSSLTLTESQNRFSPASALTPAFAASGVLTAPADALINSAFRFSAVVQDADGARRTVTASTTVVTSTPDPTPIETAHGADFPTLFVQAPREALPNQQVAARAVAPTARVDLELPMPTGIASADTILLTRAVTIGSESRLLVLDQLSIANVTGGTVLRTTGRELPGMTEGGTYGIVAAHDPLTFVTGLASGPEAFVLVDGLPFAARTGGPNGRFAIPVRTGQPFTLRFFGLDGQARGSATGQAPTAGTVDIGDPLGATSGLLTVQAEPDERSIVDINAPLILRFSEPIDDRTVSGALVVTDQAGTRVFGRVIVAADGLSATFIPTRRWRFGTTYRYGVSGAMLARSGARLAIPFSGQFTAFRPAVVSTLPLGDARDVTVSGGTAVVGTDTGFLTVNVASPRDPQVVGRVSLLGGAGAVTLLSAPVTNRNGSVLSGPFAVVGTGSESAGARLQTYELSNLSAPSLVGSTQLANASGQSPASGVPPFLGIPHSILVGPDARAFLAIRQVGLSSVRLGDAIPVDPASPARGAGPRYPSTAAESVSDVAPLDDRLLLAGVGGLTVLDATTLQRIGGVGTTGNAQGVSAAPAFSMDVNGDGVIAPDTEVFDLAVVANGLDGTLQFYRLPATGDPLLLSAVRFSGEASDVVLDPAERLAYVSLGSRGLAIVDLDGPASVQPIDTDRNGVDDRVLGIMDTPGVALRTALDLQRGLGYIADGSAGLAIAHVVPPRTKVLSLKRDPVRGFPGDEEEILGTRVAFTTDDGLRVILDATVPPGEALLAVVETIGPDPENTVTFSDGSNTIVLTNGLNDIGVELNLPQGSAAGRVSLRIVTSQGQAVTSLDVELRSADPTIRAQALFVAPSALTLSLARPTLQLSVGASMSDGTTQNVTLASQGTRYFVNDARIAVVSVDGVLRAVAGGTTGLTIVNGSATRSVVVSVDFPVSITTLEARQARITLTSPGARETLDVSARFSDGTRVPGAQGLGTIFSTSNAAVATVDQAGAVTAVAEGLARITARNGDVTTTLDVWVEFRTPAAIVAIAAQPFSAPVSIDEGRLLVRAVLSGTGSLEGLPVVFTASGAISTTQTVLSDYAGDAIATLRPLQPGPVTITAAVVNPAAGDTLSSTTTASLLAGTGDNEPNGDVTSASPLAMERAAAGILGSADQRDVYRASLPAAGVLSATLRLAPGTNPGVVRLILLSASGAEVARLTPTGPTSTIEQAVAPGAVFLAVEGDGQSVSYNLRAAFLQGELAITSMSPAGGGPGTVVAIEGTGFSSDASKARVLFGGIAGRTLSASNSRIEVLVPQNGGNGPVTVISGARRMVGPVFTTGKSGPKAQPYYLRRPDLMRFDPIVGVSVDVTKLTVFADALATEADVAALAASVGATIIGASPSVQSYVFWFADNERLSTLHNVKRTLRTDSRVRLVTLSARSTVFDAGIDVRDFGNGIAYDLGGVFDAIEAIRTSATFCCDRSAFADVKVAIVDSGFNPKIPAEFTFNGRSIVTLYLANPQSGLFAPTTNLFDGSDAGHGTGMTSIIAALNNANLGDMAPASGVLNGVFEPMERPYDVSVYGVSAVPPGSPVSAFSRDASPELMAAALSAIADEGDIDVVSFSLGTPYSSVTQDFIADKDRYFEHLLLFSGRTLFVAGAGNGGVDAEFSVPGVLALDLPEVVISVGGVDVGERADFRFQSGGEPDGGRPCGTAPVAVSGSNCGPSVTIAAPGAQVFRSASLTSDGPGWLERDGTSSATPLVAGAAALLQAIRGPGVAPLAPINVRHKLVSTGKDISASWDDGPLARLDLLKAVRSMLPPPASQAVYIANQGESRFGGAAGVIVGLEIDPMTGRPFGTDSEFVIPLEFTAANGEVFRGQTPYSMVVSPRGDYLYVVVSSQTYGDGILVVNTSTNKPETFIPFSGDPFPSPGGPQGPPIRVNDNRVPMVISKDGRLLYVAPVFGIQIINTVQRIVVERMGDLPVPYEYQATRALDGSQPSPTALADRLAAIRQAVTQGIPIAGGPRRAGDSISALTLSPRGDMLFAAFTTSKGGGNQPGGILAIDVNLYTDAQPAIVGLQPDLSRYMTMVTSQPFQMASAGRTAGGDEPSGLAISPDGRHLYLTHGGLNQISALFPTELQPARYAELIGGPGFGLAAATNFTGGAAGVANSISASGNSTLYEDLRRELGQIADSGITMMSAPGFTGVFDVRPGIAIGQQEWLFPSTVVTGWNPTAGGPIVDQFRFREVFAARPNSMAIRPDGNRAIMAFAQTGNFGILDLDEQIEFRGVATPNPIFATLSDRLFQALLGVTPAIALGPDLVPSRGAFTSADGGFRVPSPDQRLMGTWQVEYSQNGRFAVATHVGSQTPDSRAVLIPDFQNDASVRASLVERGFVPVSPSTMRAPDGTTVSSTGKSTVTVEVGGGAVSIIRDQDLSPSITDRSPRAVAISEGGERPWFSVIPVCVVTALEGGDPAKPLRECAPGGDGVDRRYEYQSPSGAKRFDRPRGVTIFPYVHVNTPRFGDHVQRATIVEVAWREPRVQALKYAIVEMDAPSGTTPFIYEAPAIILNPEQRSSRSVTAEFAGIFPSQVLATDPPVNRRRYRIVVALYDSTAAGSANEVSTTAFEVTYEDYAAPVLPSRLTLSPTVGPISITTGSSLTISTLLRPAGTAGAPSDNVTTDPSTSYSWSVGATATGKPLGSAVSGLLDTAIQQIRDRLTASNGAPVAFGRAPISVQGNSVVAAGPGIEVLQASHNNIASNKSIVLAGFSIADISLEPIVESALETGTLGSRIFAAFGTGQNAPVVVAPSDSGFIDDDNQIILNEVMLQYTGGGRISLNDLMSAIRPLIEEQFSSAIDNAFAPPGNTPTWRNAQALVKLLEGPGTANLNYTLDLSTTSSSVASFLGSPFFRARITSNAAGLALVTGRLNLGGFGTGTDSVLVWSLSSLESVQIDPPTLQIDRTSSPSPGPALRAVAHVSPISANLAVPAGYANGDQALASALPSSMRGTFSTGLGSAFRFNVSGSATSSGSTLQFSEFRLAFNAPNDDTTDVRSDWSIGGNVVVLGTTTEFDQHVTHQNVVGVATLTYSFRITGLGNTSAQAQIEVCNCSPAEEFASVSDAGPGGGIPFVVETPRYSFGGWRAGPAFKASFQGNAGEYRGESELRRGPPSW